MKGPGELVKRLLYSGLRKAEGTLKAASCFETLLRGELAFGGTLWSRHACAHSAVIAEGFLRDRVLLSHILPCHLALSLEITGDTETKTPVLGDLRAQALDLGTPRFEPHICCSRAL